MSPPPRFKISPPVLLALLPPSQPYLSPQSPFNGRNNIDFPPFRLTVISYSVLLTLVNSWLGTGTGLSQPPGEASPTRYNLPVDGRSTFGGGEKGLAFMVTTLDIVFTAPAMLAVSLISKVY